MPESRSVVTHSMRVMMGPVRFIAANPFLTLAALALAFSWISMPERSADFQHIAWRRALEPFALFLGLPLWLGWWLVGQVLPNHALSHFLGLVIGSAPYCAADWLLRGLLRRPPVPPPPPS